ncbi:uncharacterized protein LOC135139017 isoform X1 [Zophobas morio]|uniref:uncharacterized protein LOC135139017 isoform X1 n=1 Tax=Zophobas morio TaxID=2755281 RepID=UPI003082CE19
MPFMIFFLLVTVSCTNEAADLNVGTTLFTKADNCKECWSSESLALLTSRMILEDLLPSTSILVIDSNEFVSDLVEYFRMILETVRQETHGKTKHITLLALTDLLGGYLHHAVLPIAKYAYYAGLIDYDSMATLLGLFDELKWFLRTNGQGWAKPLPQNMENFEIQRIPLQPISDKDQCANLIFVEGNAPDEKSSRCDATIPLPFFDSITRPSAIALPTKTCPLYNVESNTSSYLVMKFFVTSYKCLQWKNVKTENMEKFQNEFCHWIEEQILPRLQDEKFYSAFGGVLRVRNTLKRLGVTQNNLEKQLDEFRHAADQSQNENLAPTNSQMSTSSMILTAVLITIFVWFLLGTLFICYKMRQTKQKGTCPCPEGGDKTTTCSSLISSKYFYPEKPKLCVENKGGVRRHEIIIKACRCDNANDEEEGDETTLTPASAGMADSSHTDGRLPSITEMSEQSTSTPKRARGKRSPGGSTTAGTNDPNRTKVKKQVYDMTDSESEESTEPP